MKHKPKIITISIIIIITILSILIFYNQNKITNAGLKEITYKEIQKKKQNNDDFILIVSRTNCSHCNTYKPKVEQIANNYNITVYYINIDLLSKKNEKKFLKEQKLDGATPMTLFFIKGKETSILNRIEGDVTSQTIKQQFKKMGFID